MQKNARNASEASILSGNFGKGYKGKPFFRQKTTKSMDFLMILAIILPISGVSAYVARLALNPNQMDSKLKKKYLDYISELEQDNKYLEGMMKRMKSGPKISEDLLEDPKNAILSLAGQFEHLLPAKLKPFLRDPKLLEIALDFYQKDPEKAKQILMNFVGKGRIQPQGEQIEIAGHKFAKQDAL